jgi:hypothetical protein
MSLSLANLIAVAGQYEEGLDRDTFLRLTMPFVEGGEEHAEDFVAVLTAVFRAFCNEGTTIQYPELLIVGLSDLVPPTLPQCAFVVHSFAAAEEKGLDRAELAEVIYSILLVRRACLPAELSAKLRERTVNRMAQTIARSAVGAHEHMSPPALLALITGPNIVRALEAATRTLNMKPWVNTMRRLFNIRVGDIARVINALGAASEDDGRISESSFMGAVAAALWSEEGATPSPRRRERLVEIFSVFDRAGRGEADTDELAAGLTRLACPGSGKATVDAVLLLYGEAVGASVDISELSDFLQATRASPCLPTRWATAARTHALRTLAPLVFTLDSCTRTLRALPPLVTQARSRKDCLRRRSASTARSSKPARTTKRVASWPSSTSTERV